METPISMGRTSEYAGENDPKPVETAFKRILGRMSMDPGAWKRVAVVDTAWHSTPGFSGLERKALGDFLW